MIRDMVKKERIDFLAIQETKLEEVSDSLCFGLWGSDDCQWISSPSQGNSGGLLSIWCKSSFSLIFSFSGEGFVGACLEWGVNKQICYIVNIYSKCDLASKRKLWEVLLMSKNGFGGNAWCVLGDFNAILHREERRGVNDLTSSSLYSEMADFNTFVRNMDLEDLPVLGRKFTWSHPNGSSVSRIDRVLVSEGWLSNWGYPSLWVLPRTVSDHCPLVLRYNGMDWGPRPFRFNNFWLTNSSFKGLVVESWRTQNCSGWMGHVLKEKLKGLKASIREWNKDVYGAVDTKILLLVEDINELDIRGDLMGLTAAEVETRKKYFSDLWHLLKSKESLVLQKSRSRWLREGDANTSYFHSLMKSRGKRNMIRALEVDGSWVESPLLIRQAALTFFQNQFFSQHWFRPSLDGVNFPSL
jgi:hypothetical protein